MTNNEPALSLDDILNYETPSTGSSKFKLETSVYILPKQLQVLKLHT